MDEMWRRQEVIGADYEAGVRDVLVGMNEHSKQRAYTTVATTMIRLADKGLLTRRRRGNMDIYRIAVGRDDYASRRAQAEVSALLERYGEFAVAHFARTVGPVDARRLRELRELVRDD